MIGAHHQQHQKLTGSARNNNQIATNSEMESASCKPRASSFLTSAKIQQRQHRFLAAAAASASGPRPLGPERAISAERSGATTRPLATGAGAKVETTRPASPERGAFAAVVARSTRAVVSPAPTTFKSAIDKPALLTPATSTPPATDTTDQSHSTPTGAATPPTTISTTSTTTTTTTTSTTATTTGESSQASAILIGQRDMSAALDPSSGQQQHINTNSSGTGNGASASVNTSHSASSNPNSDSRSDCASDTKVSSFNHNNTGNSQHPHFMLQRHLNNFNINHQHHNNSHHQQSQQKPPTTPSPHNTQASLHNHQQHLLHHHYPITNNNSHPQHHTSQHQHQHQQHHHHHQQQHQHQYYHQHQAYQQQQQQQTNMTHYKFHNDCQSSVLNYEQVKRLDYVMDQTVPIHGRGSFPTLYVKLKQLIRLLKHKLQTEHSIEIRDVRLNGSGASYVLAPENYHYNDLDLIIGTDLSDESRFDVIRDVVLECLREFLPKEEKQHQPAPSQTATIPSPPTTSSIPQSLQQQTTNTSDNTDSNSVVQVTDNALTPPISTQLVTNTSSIDSQSYGQAKNDQKIKPKNETAPSCYPDVTFVQTDHMNKQNGNDVQVDVIQCTSAISNQSNDPAQINGTNSGILQRETSKTQQKQSVGLYTDTNATSGIFTGGHSTGCSESNLKTIQQTNSIHFQQNHLSHQMPLTSCAIKEAYVHKMVKVNDDDRWSLISLGVQQSDANCCGSQVNCSVNHVQKANYAQMASCGQQHSLGVNANIDDSEATGSIEKTNAHTTSSAPVVNSASTQHQLSYLNQHQHQYENQQSHYQQLQQRHGMYQQSKKQFPNSIELKFVDRMRRKYEFSVDSFQIILDSLIQFYDYAPQPPIVMPGRTSVDFHSSPGSSNLEPLSGKRTCSGSPDGPKCLNNFRNETECETRSNEVGTGVKHNFHENTYSNRGPVHALMNVDSTSSYYHISGVVGDSPSVASSSGCSSSSSVVSSSSSSLSCDDDHEDLYCEAEGPSSSASSTSSLLGSNASSLISTDVSCTRLALHSKTGDINQSLTNDQHEILYDQNSNVANPSKKMTPVEGRVNLTSNSKESKCFCEECFIRQQALSNEIYDLELDNRASWAVISENFYPTVVGRSEYGNFKEALYHLEKKLIATRSPEEIRGGGLLKYCNLLVKNYKPTNVYQIRTLERYMCSRFFIDFSDLNQQQAKLESYLANHFPEDPIQKFDYLTILHNVVQRSTVCLMSHELRLTLNMIRDLAYKLNEQQQQQQQQSQPQPSQPLTSPQDHSPQQPGYQSSMEQHQPQYHQQKPVTIQSGIYRVKLVNYTLAKSNCVVEQ